MRHARAAASAPATAPPAALPGGASHAPAAASRPVRAMSRIRVALTARTRGFVVSIPPM